MHRSLPFAALALSLAGCTHLGTNIDGDFACRSPKANCRPLSDVDAEAVRALLKADMAGLTEAQRRIALAAADTARTSERTLKVVFPAHVDGSGALHEEASVWTVVERARWAGELRGPKASGPRGTMRALRDALKDQARSAAATARTSDSDANLGTLSREDSAASESVPRFTPSSPPALPSPGGEASADPTTPVQVEPAAEGSDMSPTPHVRAPRSLEESRRVWPSAAAIEAAKALKRKADAAQKKEPK